MRDGGDENAAPPAAATTPDACTEDPEPESGAAAEARHAAYALSNAAAAGGDAARSAVLTALSSGALLPPLLTHPDERVRLAGAWLAVNLAARGDGDDDGAARDRAATLASAGVPAALATAADADVCADVRERCRVALDRLDGLGSGGGSGVRRRARGGDGEVAWF